MEKGGERMPEKRLSLGDQKIVELNESILSECTEAPDTLERLKNITELKSSMGTAVTLWFDYVLYNIGRYIEDFSVEERAKIVEFIEDDCRRAIKKDTKKRRTKNKLREINREKIVYANVYKNREIKTRLKEITKEIRSVGDDEDEKCIPILQKLLDKDIEKQETFSRLKKKSVWDISNLPYSEKQKNNEFLRKLLKEGDDGGEL